MKRRASVKQMSKSRWIVLAVLLGTGTLRAGINVWTSIGPEGGQVFALAIDPQNPSTVYAGTAGGVFAITFVP